MSIDAVTSSLLSATSSTANNPQTLFKQLSDSLSSGDLAGAKAAYQSLQQLAPQGQAQNSDPNSPFAALGKALQSGDLTGAQSAFSQLQAAHKGHHGHHHHHGGGAEATSTTQQPTQALAPPGAGEDLDITI